MAKLTTFLNVDNPSYIKQDWCGVSSVLLQNSRSNLLVFIKLLLYGSKVVVHGLIQRNS